MIAVTKTCRGRSFFDDSRRAPRRFFPFVAMTVWLLVALLAAPAAAAPPATTGTSWWLNLRSTAYAYQTDEAAGTTRDHLRAYQHVSGTVTGLAGGRIKLRASSRVAGDPGYNGTGDDVTRLYTAYAEIRLDPRLKARVGRQYLREGVAGLTLDGLWLSLRPDKRVDVSLWGGARAPYAHDLEVGRLSDDSAYGGRIGYTVSPDLRLAVSGAVRERNGLTAERPLGLEATAAALRSLRVTGRLTYDLEHEDWGRMEAYARWMPAPDLPVLTVQLIDRRPAIDAASYFARFTDMKRIRMARAVARYETSERFGGELEYTGTFIDDRKSSRLGAAVLLPDARLGYSLRLGDAGEESAFYGDVQRRLMSWLWVSGHASLVTYALLEDASPRDERELTTLSAGLRADLRPGLRLTAEVQSIKTPTYDEDVRLLVGLNLSMARGVSRLGLDRGGWLR